MNREGLLDLVSQRLGSRKVIWAGLRGSDAESLSDLPQFEGSFTIMDRYVRRPLEHSMAHEDSSGVRPDMERWDIDDHLDDPASKEFRHGMLRAMAAPSALVPYRPSRFLSSLCFAREDRCLNLGLFGAHQSAFDHKPWIETSVRRLGVPTLDWTYLADEEQLEARDLLRSGPVVLRRSRTSGGEGIFEARTPQDIARLWPRGDEAFVSVSPFVLGGIPVNVGATVWGDGVTVHHASLQLIGIPSCGNRPFGYCGNDFGAVTRLPIETLDALEVSVRRIGDWLHHHGYRGTFGVDFLVKDDVPLFTEINPRFQGSTAASSMLSVEAGLPCLILEHVAAFLDLPATQRPPLREQAAASGDLAQLVVHWTGERPAHVDARALATALSSLSPSCRAEALVPKHVQVHPGATAGRFLARQRLTEGGFDLIASWDVAVSTWQETAGSTV